nr:Na+/H+ antiporter subunit E [Falsiroseomonas frigidaquae]
MLPYPLLGLSLLLLWMLLQDSASPAALLLGAVLALAGCRVLVALRLPPTGPRGLAALASLRRLRALVALLGDVAVEVVRSNNAVARIILRVPGAREGRSGFVHVPLDMRNPYGLAALACILTATPGTVWVDYDEAESIMLLHVLDMIDEEQWVRIVKDKWERQLMDLFE